MGEDWTDRVQCQVCGGWYGRIAPAHLKLHGMTMVEYIEQFPDALLISPTTERGRRANVRLKPDVDKIDLVAKHLSEGMSFPSACALEGQSTLTLRNWMVTADGELSPEELDVVRRIRQGLAQAQSTAVKTLWTAILNNDWHAATWFLERTDPKQWMLKKMDGPQVSIVLPQNARSVLYLSQEETANRVTALLESVNERTERKTGSPFVVPEVIDGIFQPVEVASGTEVSTREER